VAAWPSPSFARRASRCSGSTLRRRCSRSRASGPPGSRSSFARATCGTSSSSSLLRSSTSRSGQSSTQDQHGVVHTLHYAPADNRVDIVRDDGAKLSLWWATRSEWEGLVDVAGLELEAQYGWFDKRPLTDDSPELVFVTRKP
jgi:hypothetical protein